MTRVVLTGKKNEANENNFRNIRLYNAPLLDLDILGDMESEKNKSTMNYFNPQPKPTPKEKPKYAGIKKKPKGNTDMLDFMKSVFDKRGAICEITGIPLEFSPSCCHHLLNRNNYKRFQFDERNLIIIDPDLHFSYHNNDREYVLNTFRGSERLYERMEELRIEYNLPKKTI